MIVEIVDNISGRMLVRRESCESSRRSVGRTTEIDGKRWTIVDFEIIHGRSTDLELLWVEKRMRPLARSVKETKGRHETPKKSTTYSLEKGPDREPTWETTIGRAGNSTLTRPPILTGGNGHDSGDHAQPKNAPRCPRNRGPGNP